MTIHHDKLAYGKLASGMEELSEEQILKMLQEINEEEDESCAKESLPDNSENEKRK